MAGHYAFMQKEGEAIKRVPMNEWARYRRTGHAFSTEEKYNKQQASAGEENAETPAPKTYGANDMNELLQKMVETRQLSDLDAQELRDLVQWVEGGAS